MLWDLTHHGQNHLAYQHHRQLLNQTPEVAQNWVKCAQILFQQHKNDENLSLLNEAISRFPQEAVFYLMLANTYNRIGKKQLAYDAFKRTPAIADENRNMKVFSLELQLLLEEDVKQTALAMLILDPTHSMAIGKLSQILYETHQENQVIAICQTALAHKPNHTLARYQLAVSYARLGLAEEARRILNLEEYIFISKLPYASNYAHAEEFETALVDDIMNDKTLKPDPPYKATINGLQTAILRLGEQNPALQALGKQLHLAVDNIIANFQETTLNSVLGAAPKKVRLDTWAVVYPGDGRQHSHYHPNAWLSGVYYVRIPEDIGHDPNRGSLVLGVLPKEVLAEDPPWKLRHIKPTQGTLVLFPSYIPHATIPTESNELRICVAFDVVPIPA